MNHRQQKPRLWAVWALCACLAVPCPAWAGGERTMAAIAPRASDGTIENLLANSDLRSEDWVYQRFFAGQDAGIQKGYEDTYRYHDSQKNYDLGNDDFIQAGVFSENIAKEVNVRQGFAGGVMRQRMQAAMRDIIINPQVVPKHLQARVQNVQANINKVKNSSVGLSKGSNPVKMQYGYDLYTDRSKIEFVSNTWGAGVYHSRFLGALGGTNFSDGLVFIANARLGRDLPTAKLVYTPAAASLDTSLSTWLNPRVQATVGTVVPLAAGGSNIYRVSFGIRLN